MSESVWDDLFEAVFGGWPEPSEPMGEIQTSWECGATIKRPEPEAG